MNRQARRLAAKLAGTVAATAGAGKTGSPAKKTMSAVESAEVDSPAKVETKDGAKKTTTAVQQSPAGGNRRERRKRLSEAKAEATAAT
jgi:hypothetical protein